MSDKEIKIRCGYQRLIPFGKAKNFQGELAELTEKQAAKLQNSIKQHGFVTPVFVWVDSAGGENILDGHQRLFVIDRMIKSDGYVFEQVPVVDVYANSKTEAAEILLKIKSEYGKVTPEGLYQFGHDMEIDWDAVLQDIELPQVDLNMFADGFLNPDGFTGTDEGQPPDDFNEYDENIETEHKCPKCGYRWSGNQA